MEQEIQAQIRDQKKGGDNKSKMVYKLDPQVYPEQIDNALAVRSITKTPDHTNKSVIRPINMKFLHKPMKRHEQKSSLHTVGDWGVSAKSHIGMQAAQSILSGSKDDTGNVSRISSFRKKREAQEALESYVQREENAATTPQKRISEVGGSPLNSQNQDTSMRKESNLMPSTLKKNAILPLPGAVGGGSSNADHSSYP